MTDEALPPGNPEAELKIAYKSAIEMGVIHYWNRHALPGVHADEVFTLYKRAWTALQSGAPAGRLASERWARTVKHLALAYGHEAKIDYLAPRTNELPCLSGAFVQYQLQPNQQETAQALLESAAKRLEHPMAPEAFLETARRLLDLGKRHLALAEGQTEENELLHVVRVQAAHEYGRTLEYLFLALEADALDQTPRAA